MRLGFFYDLTRFIYDIFGVRGWYYLAFMSLIFGWAVLVVSGIVLMCFLIWLDLVIIGVVEGDGEVLWVRVLLRSRFGGGGMVLLISLVGLVGMYTYSGGRLVLSV